MNEVEAVKEFFKRILDVDEVFLAKDKNGHFILMSKTEYEEFVKEKRNKEYLAMLDKSFKEAESGGFITKEV